MEHLEGCPEGLPLFADPRNWGFADMDMNMIGEIQRPFVPAAIVPLRDIDHRRPEQLLAPISPLQAFAPTSPLQALAPTSPLQALAPISPLQARPDEFDDELQGPEFVDFEMIQQEIRDRDIQNFLHIEPFQQQAQQDHELLRRHNFLVNDRPVQVPQPQQDHLLQRHQPQQAFVPQRANENQLARRDDLDARHGRWIAEHPQEAPEHIQVANPGRLEFEPDRNQVARHELRRPQVIVGEPPQRGGYFLALERFWHNHFAPQRQELRLPARDAVRSLNNPAARDPGSPTVEHQQRVRNNRAQGQGGGRREVIVIPD